MCSFTKEQNPFSVVRWIPDCIAWGTMQSWVQENTCGAGAFWLPPPWHLKKRKHRPFGWNLIQPSLSHFSMGNRNEDSNKKGSKALSPCSSGRWSGSPNEHWFTIDHSHVCSLDTGRGDFMAFHSVVPAGSSCFGAKMSKKLIHVHYRLPSANLLFQCPVCDQCFPIMLISCDFLSTLDTTLSKQFFQEH